MEQDPEASQRPLTEMERHWDQVCLTLITIGTAAMAAVFLISGLGDERPEPLRLITVIKLIFTGLATLLYATLVLTAGLTMFPPAEIPKNEFDQWKQQRAAKVFSIFGTLIMTVVHNGALHSRHTTRHALERRYSTRTWSRTVPGTNTPNSKPERPNTQGNTLWSKTFQKRQIERQPGTTMLTHAVMTDILGITRAMVLQWTEEQSFTFGDQADRTCQTINAG